jgi:hypothetical protein
LGAVAVDRRRSLFRLLEGRDRRAIVCSQSERKPVLKRSIQAFFAKTFDGVQPAETKPQSISATLRPYRRELVAKRREGYLLRQITERLKAARCRSRYRLPR